MGRPLVNGEAVLYGRLVQGAYAMFTRDPSSLRPEPQPGDLPDPYEFVAWIHMSDFIPGRTEPRFYGLIARNKNTQADFAVAIRGTEGLVEWWDDASAYMVPFAQVPDAGRVAHGFDKIYSTLKIEQHPRTAGRLLEAGPLPELQGSFGDQLEELHKRLERVSTKETVVNRAKGAARASLHCDRAQSGSSADHALRDGERGEEEVRHHDVVQVCLAPRWQHGICANFQFAAHRVVAHRQLLGSGAQAPASHSGYPRL
jgi:hypothetical protein